MDNLIELVNNEVLQERINSVRNQREDIRDRMRNPGLYGQQVTQPTTATQTQTTTPTVPTYRPAGSLQKAALQDLYNYSNDQSSSSASGEGPQDYAGPTEGLGLNSLMAGILGNVASMGVGKMGAPGPIGGLVSGVTSALLGKGDPSNKITNSAIKAAISLAFPQLSPVIGLASMFGLNMRQGLSELFGVEKPAPGYEGGFFGTQGIGSGIDTSLGGLQDAMSGAFGSDAYSGGGGTPSGYDQGDLGSGLSSQIGYSSGLGFDSGNLGGLQGVMSDTFSSDYGWGGLGSDYGGGDYGGGGYSSGDSSYGGSSGNE